MEKDMAHKRTRNESTAEKNQAAPLTNKEYAKELKQLHVELVKLQQWVVHNGLKVCIVFEGRDGAGKGGTGTWPLGLIFLNHSEWCSNFPGFRKTLLNSSPFS